MDQFSTAKHYRFGFRRPTGKLTYLYVWATSLIFAHVYAQDYAIKHNLLCVGYRPQK